MTDEEMKKITLGELETLAYRMANAAKTIRDAFALMNPNINPGEGVGTVIPPIMAPQRAPLKVVPEPAPHAAFAPHAGATEKPVLINGLPSLLDVPDEELDAAQLKRKKEQQFRSGPPRANGAPIRFDPSDLAKKQAILDDLKEARAQKARDDAASTGDEEATS